MIDNISVTQIPSNYLGHINWVRKTYENDDIEISDAFQKDAIQNCAGAAQSKKLQNWTCSISITKNSKGCFLIVEDSGTVGLTGKNYRLSEIMMLTNNGKEFPNEERLARFSSLYNSSTNQDGAGLYGIGKTMYAIASKCQSYYFDSLTVENKYVANEVIRGQMREMAFEGDSAREYVEQMAGLLPKSSIGTRVIIVDPLDEIVNDIENGQFSKYIQQSWWILLNKLPENSHILVNGNEVKGVSSDIKYTHKDERENFIYSEGYRVKRFGLYVSEEGNNPFTDISYYRKGMKIGEINLRNGDLTIPDKLKDKIWAFIEVDESWENELAKIESSTHFGVNGHNKKCLCYQFLKNCVAGFIKQDLISWNYIKQKEDNDEYKKQQLDEIAKDVQGLFSKLEYPKLGTGNSVPEYSIRLFDVLFPETNSIRVETNQEIRFGIRISNHKSVSTKFIYRIATLPHDTRKLIEYQKGEIEIDQNSSSTVDIIYTVLPSFAKEKVVNDIVVTVSPYGLKKNQTRLIQFSYACDKQIPVAEAVNLVLHSCQFPQKNTRRVNSGDFLTNVSYLVSNNRNEGLDYMLKVILHDGKQDKIMDIDNQSLSIAPFEEQVISLQDIYFDPATINNYVDHGVIELRAQIVALNDSAEYKKGNKIKVLKNQIYYNCDDRKGHESAFQVALSPSYPEEYRRSWCNIIGGRQICINCTHPSYLDVAEDSELWMDYCREQILKQYVIIYWKEGRYEMFGLDPTEIDEKDPAELVDALMQQIEYVYDEQGKR